MTMRKQGLAQQNDDIKIRLLFDIPAARRRQILFAFPILSGLGRPWLRSLQDFSPSAIHASGPKYPDTVGTPRTSHYVVVCSLRLVGNMSYHLEVNAFKDLTRHKIIRIFHVKGIAESFRGHFHTPELAVGLLHFGTEFLCQFA